MKQKFKVIVASLAILSVALLPVLTPSQVGAVNVFNQACGGGGGQGVCGAQGDQLEGLTTKIINTLLFLIGIIAVIMIIIGGIRYTTSNGDANQTKSAKDTILYAVVGIVAAIMAFAIVNFVVERFR